MLTTGSKWFLGLGLVSFVLAAAYGWTTGGDGLGPITVGYYGGVGDHLGYAMLVSVGTCATFLGLLAVAIRDSDSSALAQVAGTETAPTLAPPAHLAYWPVVGAFGVALVVLGLVISNVLFCVGLIVLLAAGVEWMVLAWSDRATGDPDTNAQVRSRMMSPFEVPLASVLIGGGSIAALSRVFLTVSEHGAIVAATVAGVVVFAIGALLATRPKLSPNFVAGLLVVAALGVVGAGVVSAAHGEREMEKPETKAEPHVVTESKTGIHTPEASDNGLHANIPAGTEHASTTTTEAKG
jgi:hypothetical protein